MFLSPDVPVDYFVFAAKPGQLVVELNASCLVG